MEDNFGTKAKGKVGGFESLPERATGALPQAAVEVCEIQNEPVASSKSAAMSAPRGDDLPAREHIANFEGQGLQADSIPEGTLLKRKRCKRSSPS